MGVGSPGVGSAAGIHDVGDGKGSSCFICELRDSKVGRLLRGLQLNRESGGGGGGVGRERDCCRSLARFRFSTIESITWAPRFLSDFVTGGLMMSFGLGAMNVGMSSLIMNGDGLAPRLGRELRNAWFEERGRACTVITVRWQPVAVVESNAFRSSTGGEEFDGVVSRGAGSWLMAP